MNDNQKTIENLLAKAQRSFLVACYMIYLPGVLHKHIRVNKISSERLRKMRSGG